MGFHTLQRLSVIVVVAGIRLFAQQEDCSTRTHELLLSSSHAKSFVRDIEPCGGVAAAIVAKVIRETASELRLAFLIEALARIRQPVANTAARALLHDPRPFVRAQTALTLAHVDFRCAIPELVPLLTDKAVYGSQVSTDPYTETPMTVSVAVAKSLNRLTKLNAAGLTEVQQRRAFVDYWSRNASKFHCDGPTARE